jgi:GTP cyclohydrolase II
LAEPPTASVRRQVSVPLRFPDGYATTTQVVTFDGLVDGSEHLALNLALGHAEDERDYTPAAQMLGALGVDRVRLLTNNPDKAAQLEQLGVTVTERLPTSTYRGPANVAYLAAKAHHFTRSPVR